MSMKYIWIVILVVIIGGIVVWGTKSSPIAESPTVPETAALAGPQEPVPTDTYDAKAPLSKNKVILQNGMKIEITKEGSGTPIANGEVAVMNYTGRFENGTAFDSNIDPKFGHVEPFTFTLGAGQVIKGWDQGILGMKVGESRTLTIPGDLAYGPNGIPGAIPPNATLIFDVTLLSIK